MSVKLQLFLMITSLTFTGIILNMLRKEKLDIKYSLTWLFAGVSLIILALQPNIVFDIAHFVGIQIPSNGIFLFGIFFVLLITFSLTVALSRQSVRMRKMAQEMALLENLVRSKEEKS